MRIGIDIDDTLVSSSESYDNVVRKYNLNINKKFNETFTKEEIELVFNNYSKEILMSAEFKEDAIDVVKYLSSLGHEIFIITARSGRYSSDIPDLTRELIKEKLNITEIYFNEWKKSDLAKKLKIDLMIDDNIFVYNNMRKENIDCILFGDKIKTWMEVLKYIKEKEDNNG